MFSPRLRSIYLWRVSVVLILGIATGLPVLLPFGDAIDAAALAALWNERTRLAELALQSLLLMGGTLALALPIGILGAVLLYRTDLPGRAFWRFILLILLFLPLPLFTSAWQSALGTGGWLVSGGGVWRPWLQGMGPAIWIHTVAALPWVVVLVGQGLSWVERELEEDALLSAPPWRVLWHITLPRSRMSIYAAALWVSLMVLTEITVTDMMQVRTFAEEVYTQYVLGDPAAQARAVLLCLPAVGLCWLVVYTGVQRLSRALPSLEATMRPLPLYQLGRYRWPLFAVVSLFGVLLVAVPLMSLIWKAGLGGSPPTWSASRTMDFLLAAVRSRGGLILQSLLLALMTGILTASIGFLASWLSLESDGFRNSVLFLVTLLWAMAGPVVGLGLKEAINRILIIFPALAGPLYYGPSPLPALWAQTIRLLPVAIALMWPVMRLVPLELREAARLDGAGPWQELRWIIGPLCAPVWGRAVLAVAILSLGELSAGKLVETPGSQTFAHEIFTLMHYGVTNDLAALCLLLLVVVTIGGCLFSFFGRLVRLWAHEK